eukprot:UC4_evm1s835
MPFLLYSYYYGVIAGRLALGHSSLIDPLPRNAVDRELKPWKGGNWPYPYPVLPHNSSCAHPAHEDTQPNGSKCWSCACVNGTQPCDSGQTCLWFSQGCSIGCETCDGLESNPNREDRCGNGFNATNNDPYFRTVNRDVPALSKDDWTRWNPWRSPGNAPTFDACGMAGGGPKWVGTQLSFIDTPNNKQGDLGSTTLKKLPTGVTWKINSTVETKWSIRANHGGGYIYRLCPAGKKLTENCFNEIPLQFARKMEREYRNGSRLEIHGRYLRSEYNTPENSTWAVNPFPFYSELANRNTPLPFDPPCGHDQVNDQLLCGGRFPFLVSIVDHLIVPDVAPGEY